MSVVSKMHKAMTIVESIKVVLEGSAVGLNYRDIYKEILRQNLYTFGAKDPESIVRTKLRRHCAGVDFPSASPVKHFISDGGKGPRRFLMALPAHQIAIHHPMS